MRKALLRTLDAKKVAGPESGVNSFVLPNLRDLHLFCAPELKHDLFHPLRSGPEKLLQKRNPSRRSRDPEDLETAGISDGPASARRPSLQSKTHHLPESPQRRHWPPCTESVVGSPSIVKSDQMSLPTISTSSHQTFGLFQRFCIRHDLLHILNDSNEFVFDLNPQIESGAPGILHPPG